MSGTASLFGFKDFIAALALLVIVYTMSDARYRFRVAVAPISLFKLTFAIVTFVGFGTLLTDIWISEKYLIPDSYVTTSIWQGTLAALFLGLVITWMKYAFISPPRFGRKNFQKYAKELYQNVLRGSDSDLPVIAHELIDSANSLVTLAHDLKHQKETTETVPKAIAEGYANDMLLLIANRKFCRHIVASSPLTAIRFIEAVVKLKAYDVPIGLFLKNVSIEAISNKDSVLYHEDNSYSSGLLGAIKPLSTALYGNYSLAEKLKNHSPLDIDYDTVLSWDNARFETYCRAFLMTFSSYLDGSNWGRHSYVLYRALSTIHETTSRAILEIKRTNDDYLGDAWNRLRTGVNLLKDCVNLIERMEHVPKARNLRIRTKDRLTKEDFYDHLAHAIFEVIHAAAYIDGPSDRVWSMHYVAVWGEFFGIGNHGSAWKIVQFKIKRLLYNEIRVLETFPNYKGARLLGICLNVMGLKLASSDSIDRKSDSLKSAILSWLRSNYLLLREANLDVANESLKSSVTFDAESNRIVKTFAKGLSPKPTYQYLELSLAKENEYPWQVEYEVLSRMSVIELMCHRANLRVRKLTLERTLAALDDLDLNYGKSDAGFELQRLVVELSFLRLKYDHLNWDEQQ